jgi:hypothetical protein
VNDARARAASSFASIAAAALCVATSIGCSSAEISGTSGTSAPRPVAWTENSYTQPVPSWASPVRLNLPVPLASILIGPGGGIGAFGAHQGGHVEGLNHVWIPTLPGTVVRSWAAGTVTRIEDMGDRGTGDGRHEYFITIDYGRGLVGKHIDVDTPLVKVGDVVKEGDPVAAAPTAEFYLIDNYRTDGERTGGATGSPVSPFDYLRDDVKAALVARHVAEVVEPAFKRAQTLGNSRPWEPLLTNPMLTHTDRRGTIVGEWILVNKGWRTADPLYFDVMVIFDVTNAYGHFQRIEMMDHDWSMPGNKHDADATWQAGDGPGRLIVSVNHGSTYYGLYTVDESSGRARLSVEWKAGSYPAAMTANAAVYVERSAIYLHGDAQALGLIR